jgi:hypothetical protein
MDHWISTHNMKPKDSRIVETKIDDEKGLRNEAELRYEKGRWFVPSMQVYVYYEPTHWREIG